MCKIRVLNDEQKTLDFAQGLEANGCQMLVVHGRTKEQKREKMGRANWDLIKKIKQSLSIPVIANGGLEKFSDIERCLEYTGCDGVMSAWSVIENPCFFACKIPNPFEIVIEYLQICHKLKEEHGISIKKRLANGHVWGMYFFHLFSREIP
eukprot:TRINITY_DN4138_c0_g1_i1.p1 TRINITY_DN4138_c0_g1~~TRINITY_DN4138_c0_g1_i1.p1  ORF type:complete len:151 (+),score=27.41 TRINITY_DN4138_c0_g1_i1:555-1007(+)